jgi:hypothetical protein
MNPQDGIGYGRSIYWNHAAKEIANENGETCPSWGEELPALQITCSDGSLRTCKVLVGCFCINGELLKCREFPITERIITNKFKSFYI